MITIGMPVYNDISFIEESLKSILDQTYRDFTLIISDDNSSDGSGELCRKYAAKDKRIQYIRQESNLGISKNMKLLLSLCKTKYFMWAGDDDLWHSTFIEKMIRSLEENKDCIAAFGTFSVIDDLGNIVEKDMNFDYGNPNLYARLKYFIKKHNDRFGYGVFVTDKIIDVVFPIWWWPNKKCAYNNIYPSLCFYLAIGNYVHTFDESLFFQRDKSIGNINHFLPYRKSAISETLAYFVRKFNLVVISIRTLQKTPAKKHLFRISLLLFYYWFWVPSKYQLKILFLLLGGLLFKMKKYEANVHFRNTVRRAW